MTTLIFCLIFIQVSIFLIAGVVLAATFCLGHGGAEQNGTEPMARRRPFKLSDVALTRSEVSFLLGDSA